MGPEQLALELADFLQVLICDRTAALFDLPAHDPEHHAGGFRVRMPGKRRRRAIREWKFPMLMRARSQPMDCLRHLDDSEFFDPMAVPVVLDQCADSEVDSKEAFRLNAGFMQPSEGEPRSLPCGPPFDAVRKLSPARAFEQAPEPIDRHGNLRLVAIGFDPSGGGLEVGLEFGCSVSQAPVRAVTSLALKVITAVQEVERTPGKPATAWN